MAGLDLTPIPASKRGSRTPLSDIDPSLGETVEEAFAFCTKDPQRLQTPAFASKDDAEAWLTDARAYAYQRPAGRIVVAGNSTRAKNADGTFSSVQYVVRFRVIPFTEAAAASQNTSEV